MAQSEQCCVLASSLLLQLSIPQWLCHLVAEPLSIACRLLQVNPFEEYNDYFTREQEKMPILDAPVPKRRFIPSKHEEKK